MITDEAIEALKLAAGEATPGPWEQVNGADIFTDAGAANALGLSADENDGWQIADCNVGKTSVGGELESMAFIEQKSNAKYIAAANPQTVISLIERLEAAERDVARINHFETFSEAYGSEDIHEGNSWSMHGPYRTFREAIDADIAHIAAEQGDKHE